MSACGRFGVENLSRSRTCYPQAVDARTRAALDCIAEAEAEVKSLPPIVLTDDYLRMVRAVEALPENQDGADKSHVWRIWEYCRRHFAKAVLQ